MHRDDVSSSFFLFLFVSLFICLFLLLFFVVLPIVDIRTICSIIAVKNEALRLVFTTELHAEDMQYGMQSNHA